MRVYKCDHCGKFVKWRYLYKIEMQAFPPFAFVSTKHLCKECYRILCEWIQDPDEKELCALLGDPAAKEGNDDSEA